MKYFFPLLLILAAGCAQSKVSAPAEPPKPKTTVPEPAATVIETPKPVDTPAVIEPAKVNVTHSIPEKFTLDVKFPTPPPDLSKFIRDPAPPPLPPAPNPNPNPPPEIELSLPAVIAGDVGAFIVVTAVTNCAEVEFYPLDSGLAVFPRKMLNSETATVVTATVPGDYRILAYTAMGNIPSAPVLTIVRVGHAPQPPPGPAPNPNPGPVPPPPAPTPGIETAAQLWIIVVDDITRRQQATAAILADPIWNSFRTAGHKVRFYNITDPAAENYKSQLAANGGQPVLVIMSIANNHWLNKDPADLKLQATPAGLQNLVNKYTGKQ